MKKRFHIVCRFYFSVIWYRFIYTCFILYLFMSLMDSFGKRERSDLVLICLKHLNIKKRRRNYFKNKIFKRKLINHFPLQYIIKQGRSRLIFENTISMTLEKDHVRILRRACMKSVMTVNEGKRSMERHTPFSFANPLVIKVKI